MLSWQNICNSIQIALDIKEKLVNQKEALRGGISRIYPSFQTNGNHITELSTFGQVISERHWKGTFDFTNYKQLRAEVRNSMPNFEIYSPLFSEGIHTILKIFSQHGFKEI